MSRSQQLNASCSVLEKKPEKNLRPRYKMGLSLGVAMRCQTQHFSMHTQKQNNKKKRSLVIEWRNLSNI